MVFNNAFDISDIVYILTFIIAASSAIFTLCKWNRSRRIKQADYIKSLIEFKNNEIILEVFNLFDYLIYLVGLSHSPSTRVAGRKIKNMICVKTIGK